MDQLNCKSSVFKRPSRIKKTKGVDAEGNPKTVKVKGGWVYRIRYTDLDGTPRTVERGPWPTKNEARDARDAKFRELTQSAGQIRTGERMTFNHLADICEAEFYGPAIYSHGVKIAGAKSSRATKGLIKNLREFFGDRLINSITTESLRKYKVHRASQTRKTAKSESATSSTIKLSTINRELAVMRKMMLHAHRKGYLLRDVFYKAEVIDTANEKARDVTLSPDDELKLLASCQGERIVPCKRVRRGQEETFSVRVNADNPLLKAIIILALDSGMRLGEILKMRWADIDFLNNVITVVGTHTKTQQERLAPLTDRAEAELDRIRPITDPVRPFPFTDIKKSFKTAVRLAGIKELRFHDLRRTFVTRRLMEGIAPAVVSKIAGHAQVQTTMKHYTSIGLAEIQQVSAHINARNPAGTAPVTETQLIN